MEFIEDYPILFILLCIIVNALILYVIIWMATNSATRDIETQVKYLVILQKERMKKEGFTERELNVITEYNDELEKLSKRLKSGYITNDKYLTLKNGLDNKYNP